MELKLPRSASSRPGPVAATPSTPIVTLSPLLRARAAQGALGLLAPFVLGQAAKASLSLAPLDALRFSRSALPLARDLRALVAGMPELQKALSAPVQAMEPLAEARPEQVERLQRSFDALCKTLRTATLKDVDVGKGDPVLQSELTRMLDALNSCRTSLAEDAATGARKLITCCDTLAGRSGMTRGIGTFLAEEAKLLTSALVRPPVKDGADELGICFDARTSFSRVRVMLVSLQRACSRPGTA